MIKTKEKNLSMYLFLVDGQTVEIVMGYDIEEVFIEAKRLNPGAKTIRMTKSLDYNEVAKSVIDFYGEQPDIKDKDIKGKTYPCNKTDKVIEETPTQTKNTTKTKNDEETINFLKVIRDIYGNKYISKIIKIIGTGDGQTKPRP